MTCATSSLTPTTTAAGFNKPIIQKWSLSNGGVLFYKRSLTFTRPCATSSSSSSSSSTSATTKKKQKNKKKGNDDDDEDEEEGEKEKDQVVKSSDDDSLSMMKRLDDVNPVGLGRKSRQIFDEVWRKFSGLGQISRTIRTDDDAILIREGGPMCEFAIPGAQNTTVLVVGATSRVGRVVVRKLMLRGYNVKV